MGACHLEKNSDLSLSKKPHRIRDELSRILTSRVRLLLLIPAHTQFIGTYYELFDSYSIHHLTKIHFI